MGNARRRGNPASQTFPLLLLIITAVFVPRMEYISQVSVGCNGNAWKGYICDTTFPQLVEGAASLGRPPGRIYSPRLGCVFSLVVTILASVFCMIFWLCTYRINRDLTKTYLLPVLAPYTLLLPMELAHSILLLVGKEDSDMLVLFPSKINPVLVF